MFSKAKRSWFMARIRTRATEPERLVRKLLRSAGYRVRFHDNALPGRPDIVVPECKAAIYVHGCFWHGHQHCEKGRRRPRTNSRFWSDKIESNIARDQRVSRKLRRNGWHVVTIWECEMADEEKLGRRLRRFLGGVAGA